MAGNPRLRVPQRDQIEMHWASLNELLEPEHPARMVWACVCGLDLGQWLKTIKAVEGVVGRDATDPRLLVALWIYATIEGVGSARELERLCQKHLVYQWLCGGVSVNYHLLSDFRSRGGNDVWRRPLTIATSCSSSARKRRKSPGKSPPKRGPRPPIPKRAR
jgi:transposase